MHTHSRFLPTLMHKALSRIRRAPLQCLLAGLALLQAPALEAHMDPREALLQAPVVIEIDIERGDLTVIAEYANGLSAPEVPPLLLRANRDEVLTGGEVSRTLEKRRKHDSVTTELLDEYLDEDVTVVKWHYALPGLPEIIEIIPQTGEKTAIQARHAGLAVNQLNFLQQPEMLLLDWVDPWHTRFRNPGIRRAYQLPVMLYLAEEDDALRFEAVLRVVDVLGIEDIKQTWNGHTRDDISHQVIELVKQHAHLSVNGQPVPFDLVSSNFVDRTVKGITKLPDSTDIQALTGTLALVFTAKKPDGPGERQLDWDFYNDSVEEVPLSLKGPNHLSESKTLSQADSTFAWSYAGRVVAPRPALPQAQRQPYTELPVSWALLVLASLLALISLIRRKEALAGLCHRLGHRARPRPLPAGQPRQLSGGRPSPSPNTPSMRSSRTSSVNKNSKTSSRCSSSTKTTRHSWLCSRPRRWPR